MARIIFMGTPEFAVPALRALHAAYQVCAVVTIPDKPKGRGLVITPSAVKIAALELGISTILQPTSLKDPEFLQSIKDLQPDIICVIAFKILPKEVYSAARLGSFNVHASLLPKYRGAAPINHAIICGDTISGVTSFLLNDVVDTGTILLQHTVNITTETTAGELYSQLMPLAATSASETCALLLSGKAQPLQQDDSQATTAPKVFRETSRITWNKTASEIRNYIHGLSPSPCAWFLWDMGAVQTIKVLRAKALESHPALKNAPVGTYCIIENDFFVQCAHGVLQILELQFPGKQRTHVASWALGFRGAREGALL